MIQKFYLSLSAYILFLGLSFFSQISLSQPAALSVLEQTNQFISQQSIDFQQAGWKNHLNKPPILVFDPDKRYFWDIATNKGNITILLMPDAAPMHVSSTIYLTQLGFYDNLIFHRVIRGFMAQGGDPLGNGSGGPGYTYSGEFTSHLKHDRPGVVSMANVGEDSDGSQFFLTFEAVPHLDGKHTIFGQVVMGIETLLRFESLGSESGQTKQELKIMMASIREE